MNLGPALELIKSFEGLLDGDPTTVNFDPYLCPAGVWTIGWGHAIYNARGRRLQGNRDMVEARAIYPNGISMIEAEMLLRDDIRKFVADVKRLVKVPLTNNQFCALVSFTYNVGSAALGSSTLLRYVNKGMFDRAPEQFMRWTKAGGKESRGLVRRRQAEVKLWQS